MCTLAARSRAPAGQSTTDGEGQPLTILTPTKHPYSKAGEVPLSCCSSPSTPPRLLGLDGGVHLHTLLLRCLTLQCNIVGSHDRYGIATAQCLDDLHRYTSCYASYASWISTVCWSMDDAQCCSNNSSCLHPKWHNPFIIAALHTSSSMRCLTNPRDCQTGPMFLQIHRHWVLLVR